MKARRFAAAALLLWLAVPAQSQELVDVPHPDIDMLKPAVQASLEPALALFRRQQSSARGAALAGAYGKLGLHYQAHEQQAATRASYQNAMILNPGDYRWPYYLAVHYEETGEFPQAVEHYLRALELNGQYVPAAVRLGLLRIELGQPDLAQPLLEAVVEVKPKSAAALAGLGAIAAGREAHAEAADYYRRALEIQPEATQLHYRLGLVYRQQGEVEKARAELAQQGPRIPSIPDPLLLLMQAFRYPAEHYLKLGSEAFARGRLERAARVYEFATEIDPENLDAKLLLGRVYGAMGQSDSALARFEAVLRVAPGNVEANFYAGAIHEARGDDAAALARFAAALENDPGLHDAQLALANAQMRLGQYAAAAGNYQQIPGEQADADTDYRAGMAWLAAGRCLQAETALTSAYNAEPLAGRVIQALARLYATCADFGADKRETGLRLATLLYQGEPGLETAATLAMAHAANGNFGAAEEFQLQALFESSKRGDAEAQAWLRKDLDRYRSSLPAEAAWPAGHAVFQPPRRAGGAGG